MDKMNELFWNGDVAGEYTKYAPDKCSSSILEIIHECKCKLPELERILDSCDRNISFDFLNGSLLYQVYLLDIFFIKPQSILRLYILDVLFFPNINNVDINYRTAFNFQ